MPSSLNIDLKLARGRRWGGMGWGEAFVTDVPFEVPVKIHLKYGQITSL